MAQQTEAAPNRDPSDTPTSGICGLLEGVRLRKNIGLDADGYSHFHAVEQDLVIICEGDRRFKSIRKEDVAETHVITGGKTTEDWVKFVQDRRGWVDLRDDLEYRAFGSDGLPDSE